MKNNTSIGVVGDLHVGARGGSDIFRQHIKQVLFDTIKNFSDNGVTYVLFLGDFFDVRRATYNKDIHWIVNEFIPFVESLNIKIIILAGNHDIALKESTEITSLDLFAQSDSFIIVKQPTRLNVLNIEIDVYPWICGDTAESAEKLVNSKPDNVEYAFGHFEFAGAKMYKFSEAEEGHDASIFKAYKEVFTGHFHHASDYGNVSYLGSLLYLNWSDFLDYDDDNRGSYILNLQTGDKEFFVNDQCLFIEESYDDSDNNDPTKQDWSHLTDKFVKVYVKSKERPRIFNKFIQQLKEIPMLSLSIIDETLDDESEDKVTVVITEAELSIDTSGAMKKYVESAQYENEKDLVLYLDEKYTTAINEQINM